jgi:hypothetical protein
MGAFGGPNLANKFQNLHETGLSRAPVDRAGTAGAGHWKRLWKLGSGQLRRLSHHWTGCPEDALFLCGFRGFCLVGASRVQRIGPAQMVQKE